jgi:opacity protein-like surface antigen
MAMGMRVSACALLVLSAGAVNAADQGFYFGASGGQAQYDFDLPATVPVIGFLPPLIGAVLPNPPVFFRPDPGTPVFFTPPPFNSSVAFVSARPVLWLPGDDDEGTAWSVSAGYRINRYLAVEASYVNLGTLEATHNIGLPAILGGGSLAFHRELETAGPALTAFGILPVSDSWELYVRAGMFFADSELTTAFNGTSNTTSFDSDSTTLGAGAQFDWKEHWSARLEFQRSFDIGGDDVASEADVDGVSLAVLYRL